MDKEREKYLEELVDSFKEARRTIREVKDEVRKFIVENEKKAINNRHILTLASLDDVKKHVPIFVHTVGSMDLKVSIPTKIEGNFIYDEINDRSTHFKYGLIYMLKTDVLKSPILALKPIADRRSKAMKEVEASECELNEFFAKLAEQTEINMLRPMNLKDAQEGNIVFQVSEFTGEIQHVAYVVDTNRADVYDVLMGTVTEIKLHDSIHSDTNNLYVLKEEYR